MIDQFFQIILSNVCISFILAIIAMVAGIILKRPAITHLLWLLVYIKLLTPPVFIVPAIPAQLLGTPIHSINTSVDKEPVMQSLEPKINNEINNPLLQNLSISSIQGRHLLLLVWLSGSMFVLIWSILQVCRFHRLLKRESETATQKVQSKAMEISIRLDLNAAPIIQTTAANISPMVWWIGGKVWIIMP